MDTQQAIIGFSQSEKIKAGLIWTSQIIGMLDAASGKEIQGGEQAARMLMEMVLQEVRLASNLARDKAWEEVSRAIERALVMVNSGVITESVSHLTNALSHVTNIGQRTMHFLKEEGLLR